MQESSDVLARERGISEGSIQGEDSLECDESIAKVNNTLVSSNNSSNITDQLLRGVSSPECNRPSVQSAFPTTDTTLYEDVVTSGVTLMQGNLEFRSKPCNFFIKQTQMSLRLFSTKNEGGKIIGRWLLNGARAKVMLPSDKNYKPFAFSVLLLDDTKLVLVAKDRDERASWVGACEGKTVKNTQALNKTRAMELVEQQQKQLRATVQRIQEKKISKSNNEPHEGLGDDVVSTYDPIRKKLEGWLYKRGRVNKKYKKRWFCWDSEFDLWRYYESEKAFRSKKKPRGRIELQGAVCSVLSNGEDPSEFGVCNENRMLVVKATDVNEAKRWMNAIDHKIQTLRAEYDGQRLLAVGLNLAQTTVREGVLKLGTAGIFGNDKWVDNYFSLADGELAWYTAVNINGGQGEKKGEFIGSISLDSNTVFKMDNEELDGGKGGLFTIVSEGETKKDDVVLQLMASSKSLASEWLSDLQREAELGRRGGGW